MASSSSANSLLATAAALSRSGDHAAAADVARKAVASAPGNGQVSAGAAAILRAAGQMNEALSCYRSAYSAEPENIDVALGLGTILLDLNAAGEARRILSQAAAAAPDSLPQAPDEIMQACFDDLLSGQGEGTGWRQHKSSAACPDELQVSNALLWGGNLTVLCSLLGTPYFPQVKGGILFLEDIAEHPYRIERMLTQLLHAGVLARQKLIVLGQFTEYSLSVHDKGYSLAKVVAELRSRLKVPVLTGLPFGHVPTKVLLPVGLPVDVLVEGREALVLWGHQH